MCRTKRHSQVGLEEQHAARRVVLRRLGNGCRKRQGLRFGEQKATCCRVPLHGRRSPWRVTPLPRSCWRASKVAPLVAPARALIGGCTALLARRYPVGLQPGSAG